MLGAYIQPLNFWPTSKLIDVVCCFVTLENNRAGNIWEKIGTGYTCWEFMLKNMNMWISHNLLLTCWYVHTTQSRTGVENQQNLERIDILCEGAKVLGNYELNVRKLFGIHSLTLPGVSIFWISKRCCFNLFLIIAIGADKSEWPEEPGTMTLFA